jgi:hypothetical protein
MKSPASACRAQNFKAELIVPRKPACICARIAGLAKLRRFATFHTGNLARTICATYSPWLNGLQGPDWLLLDLTSEEKE